MELILIVDDMSSWLERLDAILSRRGYRTLTARSGDEALKIAEAERPDLILMDVDMPGMNGFEACARLLDEEETEDIPVIFVTSGTGSHFIELGFKVGAVDYVTKPFHERELLARMRTHLSLRARTRELEDANRMLREIANVDGLTLLANRRRFDEHLKAEMNRRFDLGGVLPLLFMDIDDFKLYNDTFGHIAGDDALKRTAAVLREKSGEAGLAARYGGEEFAVIPSDELSRDVEAIAHEIREAVEALAIEHAGARAASVLTVSIGVYAAVPGTGSVPEEWIRGADEQLYRAKNEGRNRVSVSVEAGQGNQAEI